jgi:hypothetical protein
MADRFDMEQQIMSCWNVVEDIDMVCKAVMDFPTPPTEDELANLLIGLKTLYNIKFQELFSTFEQLVSERKL